MLHLVAPDEPWHDEYLICPQCQGTFNTFEFEPKLVTAEQINNIVKRTQVRGVPDLVAMRKWKGKWAITRTIVLLICLDQILAPGKLADWLELPNPNLDDLSPADLLKRGEWTVLADLVDDMLTGAPT